MPARAPRKRTLVTVLSVKSKIQLGMPARTVNGVQKKRALSQDVKDDFFGQLTFFGDAK